MAADAGNGQGRRGHNGDAPSGGGGRRLAEIGGLGLAAPTAQCDADRAASLRAKLEPARCGHVEPRNFADDSAEPTVTETFLDTGEYSLVVARLDVDHAVGREACLGQRRCEEIGPRDDPKDLAPGSRGDPGSEECRRRAIDRAVTAAGDLVERAERQATARKARVDVGDPERKHRFRAPTSAFDLLDLRAQ